jgi:CRP/FNR family cyclic AMP-dependent transcriptional regulator
MRGSVRAEHDALSFRAFVVITTVEKVLFLKSIDLFRALPGEELAQIADIAEEMPVSAGDLVFAEGELGDALYIVVEGRVRVHQGDRGLAEFGERECFGEMSVLDSEPRSASVSALLESLLLKIGREEFRDILSERPEIAVGIMKVLSRRLRESNQRK